MEIRHFKKKSQKNIDIDSILCRALKVKWAIFFFFYKTDIELWIILYSAEIVAFACTEFPIYLKLNLEAQSRWKRVACYAMVHVNPVR